MKEADSQTEEKQGPKVGMYSACLSNSRETTMREVQPMWGMRSEKRAGGTSCRTL